MAYALSWSSANLLNEINVASQGHYDDAGFIFYGQYNNRTTTVTPTVQGFDVLATFAGTYDYILTKKYSNLYNGELVRAGNVQTVTIESNGSIFMTNGYSASSDAPVRTYDRLASNNSRPYIGMWIPDDGNTSTNWGEAAGLYIQIYVDANQKPLTIGFSYNNGPTAGLTLPVQVEKPISAEELTLMAAIDVAVLKNDANFTVVLDNNLFPKLCTSDTLNTSYPIATNFAATRYLVSSVNYTVYDTYDSGLASYDNNASMSIGNHHYAVRSDGYLNVEEYGANKVVLKRMTNAPSEVNATCIP